MKKTVLALVVAAATSVALSAQAPAQTPSSQAPAVKQTAPKSTKSKTTTEAKEAKEAKAPAKAKARVETAEVVSTDATAKSITVKPKTGENQTYTATGRAVAELSKVKAGEQVRLTVRDNDVTSIRAAHAAKPSAAKKGAAKKDKGTAK